MQPNLLRNLCFLPTKNTKYRTFYRTHFLLISFTCLSRYISLSFYRPALFLTSWGSICRSDVLLYLHHYFVCSWLGGTWNMHNLLLWFGSVIQPWTTVSEPCLTQETNTNWRLILQLISRASKLFVTEGLQHEPDLTKRSFYYILSEGTHWGNMVPYMPHWLMVNWVWEHCWDQVWGTLISSLWISQDTMGMRGNISQFICTRRMLHNI